MTLKHTQRALQVLRSANRALEKASQEQQLLDEICRIAIEVGGYRFAWVGYALDDAEKTVRFMASAGQNSDYLKAISISWGEEDTGRGPAGRAIKTLKANVVQHIREHRQFSPWREKALEYGYESVIALPLSWRGNTFGCLAILSDEADAFDAQESELLQELAASLSYGINAIRNSVQRDLAEKALRTERDTQEVLRNILSLSLENISLEEKLDRVLELLFDIPWLTLERMGSIFLVDKQTRSLFLAAKRHLSPVLRDRCATVPFGHCLCGKAAASSTLVFHAHLDADHDTHFEGMQDHGHYCQPISTARGVIGVLNLYVAAGHQPSPVEAPFLGAVADSLASLIEREEAQMAQQRLITILEATPDLVTITDTEGSCLYCNDGAWNLLSDERKQAGCPQAISCHYPESVAKHIAEEIYPNAIAAGVWEGELTLNRADGKPLPVSQVVMAHRDNQGKVAYISTIARDISDRKRAEKEAQSAALREKHFANTVINNLPGIFYLVDEAGRFLRWNSNMEQSLGYSGDRLHSMTLHQLLAEKDAQKMRQGCMDTLEFGTASLEVDLVNRNGNTIPYYINGIRIERADGSIAIVGIGIDISYRKQLEHELRTQATTDPLTGAYNRLKMEQTIEHEVKKCNRYRVPFSIAMFDIDRFKQVNDSYGHDAGDKVLKQVVTIVRQQLREVDLLARWGGEEFMIIASSTTLDEIHKLAERIRAAIAAHRFEQVGDITVSFGVGEYRHGERQKTLLKRVDAMLYQAKQSGRNRVHIAL